MADTTLLAMPLIAAAQGQKHVTHNEALKVLDGLVQLSVKSRTVTAPPGSPADSDRYIIPAGATGAWSGNTDQIAIYVDGAWEYHIPKTGWSCFVEGEGVVTYLSGTGWQVASALAAHGASSALVVKEQEITVAGATTDSTIVIPARAIVLSVSERVTQAITGATSFSVGVAGETSKFGGSLGISLGSNNMGVIGPTAYYSDTAIRLTAAGGSFSGGKVRIAIHYLLFTGSAS
ncbi:MAG: DUF2793 domain-containing protein [Rhizobium sp.]|nr:DUF2793 domain-containing protein [Rhizobium sp.]